MQLTLRGRLLVVALALGIIAGIASWSHDRALENMPSCVTEDAPGPCYWDADTRGNGMGMSFIVTERGDVIYLIP